MTTYLWGLVGGYWHALTRHRPDWINEEVVSEKLTAAARSRDPDAKPVMLRVAKGSNPGMGNTLCNQRGVALEKVGVDPEAGDVLCPACQALIARQG